jgi:hypothetical protein
MFTSKQERNGTDMGVETHNSAIPGPDWEATISSMKGRAEAAGAYRMNEGVNATFMSPFGAGTSGGEYMNPGGSMWQWDAGLAVPEMPGEASIA